MKRLIGLGVVAAASLAASACAGGYGYGYGPGPVAMDDCGGFYDGFYGPFTDGCWGDDGYYWYMGQHGHYQRDTGRHFSHVASGEMQAIHGTGPGSGQHFVGAHAAPAGDERHS